MKSENTFRYGNSLDHLINKHSHHLNLINPRWDIGQESLSGITYSKCIDEDSTIDGEDCSTYVNAIIEEIDNNKLKAHVSLSFSVKSLGVVCTEGLNLTSFNLMEMEERLFRLINDWGLRDPHAIDRALGLVKPYLEQILFINENEPLIEL